MDVTRSVGTSQQGTHIMSKLVLRAALAAFMLTFCAPLLAADEPADRGPAEVGSDRSSWYYDQSSQTYQPSPRQIIQQKAMVRGAQRQARLASMKWYGMSNARPVAAATPFMSMYSPAWQMPGGRPFGWFTGERPVYVFWAD